MPIDSGKLRHRVRIEALIPVTDSAGETIQDPATGEVAREWALMGLVWAAIEPISGREFIQSATQQNKIVGRITFRVPKNPFDGSMRIVHNGTVYNVEGVLADKDSGQEYVTCPVSQGVSESGQ